MRKRRVKAFARHNESSMREQETTHESYVRRFIGPRIRLFVFNLDKCSIVPRIPSLTNLLTFMAIPILVASELFKMAPHTGEIYEVFCSGRLCLYETCKLIHTRAHTHTHTHTYTHKHTHTYKHAYTHTHTLTHSHTFVSLGTACQITTLPS